LLASLTDGSFDMDAAGDLFVAVEAAAAAATALGEVPLGAGFRLCLVLLAAASKPTAPDLRGRTLEGLLGESITGMSAVGQM
jgi:hypothetical protein